MFKFPSPPSPHAQHDELADFVELLAWDRKSASKREIVACLGRNDDNESNIGCDDDDDENSEALDEVMNELERRATACGGGYPFRLEMAGTVLRHCLDNERTTLYKYLLLCTRLDMNKARVHAGIDGTALFEEICASVLKNYLGRKRARSLVFGTAAAKQFKEKVQHLCHELHEGGGYQNPNTAPDKNKDGKLDVVAWVPFSDLSAGQLILFAQCKTGTHWEGQACNLQPDGFIRKWFKGTVAVTPVRSFCVSEACNRTTWNTTCVDAGVLLDRCRLVDFFDSCDQKLLHKINKWTSAAKSTVSYHG